MKPEQKLAAGTLLALSPLERLRGLRRYARLREVAEVPR
jgi:hypothetical protein